MSITTSEYWSVDGVPLQTMAYNITSMGGDRMSPRPFRGSDYVVPHRVGEVWQPKTVDSMTISLGMWVIGADEDGNIPAGKLPSTVFRENFEKLRKLLWTPGRRITLEKRFIDESGSLRTVSVPAEYVSGLSPVMHGRARAAFVVDLKLAYPYFHESNYRSVTLSNNGDNAVNIGGDAPTRQVRITVQGARGRLIFTNKTMNHTLTSQAVATGQRLELDVNNFDARLFTGSTSVNAVSMVTHSQNPYWLELNNGQNVIHLNSQSGTGLVTLQYKEAWL